LLASLGLSAHLAAFQQQELNTTASLQRLPREELAARELGLPLGAQLRIARWQGHGLEDALPKRELGRLLREVGLEHHLDRSL